VAKESDKAQSFPKQFRDDHELLTNESDQKRNENN
jgi:hypothetical protein